MWNDDPVGARRKANDRYAGFDMGSPLIRPRAEDGSIPHPSWYADPVRRAWRRVMGIVLAIVVTFMVAELTASLLLPAPYVDRAPLVQVAPHPVLAYKLVPRQQTFSYQAPVRTDDDGLRVLPSTTATASWVFLGGSETFGKGVDAEKTYPALVQAELGVRATNAGVPDYNIDQSVLWLERYGGAPDVVVLAFYWNDLFLEAGLNRDAPPVREWAPRAVLKRTGLLERVAPLYTRSRVAYVLRNALKERVGQWRGHPEQVWRDALLEGTSRPEIERAWVRVAEQLDRFRTLAAHRGFRPVVLALPIEHAVERGGPFPVVERIRALTTELELVDATPALVASRNAGAQPYIPWDGRPSPAGHAAIAEALVAALER